MQYSLGQLPYHLQDQKRRRRSAERISYEAETGEDQAGQKEKKVALRRGECTNYSPVKMRKCQEFLSH
jgi:hypothetical protein